MRPHRCLLQQPRLQHWPCSSSLSSGALSRHHLISHSIKVIHQTGNSISPVIHNKVVNLTKVLCFTQHWYYVLMSLNISPSSLGLITPHSWTDSYWLCLTPHRQLLGTRHSCVHNWFKSRYLSLVLAILPQTGLI